jgi:hypothetical protein
MAQNAKITWNGALAEVYAKEFGARGLNQAAEHLRSLALPLTPNLDGDLEASAQVHQTTPAELASQVQYDTPYAVMQHESLEFSHTRDPNPKAQAKFLERPAREREKDILAIVAASIRRGFS